MNSIIKFALAHRMLVLALTALLTVWGGIIIKNMPVDVFPDLNRPTVTILAEAGGMAPEEVENLVVIPIETAMNGLPGVSRVRSSAAMGFAIVWVEFDWDTQLLVNRQLVSEKLTSLDNTLPSGIVPIMGPISSLMGEIMLVGLTSETTDPMELRSIAEAVLRPRLQAIKGVAQIIPIGGGVKQVDISIDPVKLRQFGLTFPEVTAAVQNIGANSTGGFLDGAYQEYLIRNIVRPKTIEDVAHASVVVKKDISIKLRDLADVKYAAKPARGDAGVSAKKAVIVAIHKQPDVNTIALSKEIEAQLQDIQKTVGDKAKLQPLFKQATFIESAIHNVVEALRDGSIFVAIILFLFLMNFRTTAITLTAIPLSLVTTFVVLKLFGISINTMTLGGLAIAIGELVDDAIVDVENVFRRLRENKLSANPKPALKVVFAASAEVRNSIVLATIIVILVFIPLFALDGLEGRFFIPLGIAYVVSILASLLVSLTVTPVLCSLLLPQAKATEEEHDGKLVQKLKAFDKSMLERFLDNPKPVVTAGAAMVITAAASVVFMGREFLPPFNEGTVTCFVTTPPGTSLAESTRIGMIAEQRLLQIPGIEVTSRRTGRAEQDEHAEGVYNSEIDIDLAGSKKSRDQLLGEIRAALKEIPGIGSSIGQPISHRLDHMLSGVKAQISIKIFGDDLSKLQTHAKAVHSAIGSIPGLVDVEIEKMTYVPQIHIVPDHAKASAFGVQMGPLAEFLENALSGGHPVAEMFEGQRRIPVVVKLAEGARQTPGSIENLMVASSPGKLIPLREVAEVNVTTGPNAINHENGRRRIIVSANTQGRDLGSVVEDIQKVLAKDVKMSDGYFYTLGGQFENQQSASRKIALLSMISFVGIFIILYANFGSAIIALQVMLNVPLALIGSVIAIYLAGGVFSIGTLVGFITLCGIASRNGIMMISHYLHLMAFEGYEFNKEMIIKGSLERLVPVLMTALTAALALIPIVMASGEPGKEILHPVAVVILGGLVSSTLLDILLTPVIFYNYGREAAYKAIEKYKARHHHKDEEIEP